MSEAELSMEQYIKRLERSNMLAKSAIKQSIAALGITKGRGLDVPCGIGDHMLWLAENNSDLSMEGVDFSSGHIEYAKRLIGEKGLSDRLSFRVADMNSLDYPEDSFDFIWSSNGLWPGPVEMGCIAEEPYAILESMKRIVRPGGTIAVLFWTSQKLLPGYPLIENALNACNSTNIPMTEDTDPNLHVMNTGNWLRRIGLTDIHSRTFAADINGPLDAGKREAVHDLFEMFWGAAEEEISVDLWGKYKAVTDPSSEEYVLANPDYYGFLTYTMFSGRLPL